MATFALIENTLVINTVLCDNEDLAKTLWPNLLAVDITSVSPTPSIGWTYVTGSFSP